MNELGRWWTVEDEWPRSGVDQWVIDEDQPTEHIFTALPMLNRFTNVPLKTHVIIRDNLAGEITLALAPHVVGEAPSRRQRTR